MHYALRTLGVVDGNLSLLVRLIFLNDMTKVVCTILRVDVLENPARLFHAGNTVVSTRMRGERMQRAGRPRGHPKNRIKPRLMSLMSIILDHLHPSYGLARSRVS